MIYDIVVNAKRIPELYKIADELLKLEAQIRRFKRQIEDLADKYWRKDTESKLSSN